MQKWDFTPFFVLFLEGFGGIICSIVMISLFETLQCNDDWIKWFNICTEGSTVGKWSDLGLLFNSGGNVALVTVVLIVIKGLSELTLKLILYYLTLTHISISLIVNFTMVYMFVMITDGSLITEDWQYIPFTLGIILLIFGSLFYNEVLIFYFCGLERNTKKEIMKRGDSTDIEILMSMKEIVLVEQENPSIDK